MTTTVKENWERASAAVRRNRGDSILSKVSQVSSVTFRSNGSVTGRDRADSSSTIASTFAPKPPGLNLKRTDSRASLLRRNLSQRPDTRMSTTNYARRHGLRTMQAVSGFRRRGRRTSVTLGLEDITRRNDVEWMQEEMAQHQSNPRFASTLSREAQCMMLKGYEDSLWQRLVDLYPEKRNTLTRLATPRSLDTIVDSLPAVVEEEGVSSRGRESQTTSTTSAAAAVTAAASNSSAVDKPNSLQLPNVASKPANAQTEGIKSRNDSLLSNSDASVFTVLNQRRLESFPSFTPLPEEKRIGGSGEENAARQEDTQWHVSYRIQNAMDAIDKMKIADGETVTSERYKNKQMDPLTFSNFWARKWREEFPKA